MSIQQHIIESKHRQHIGFVSSVNDFTITPGVDIEAAAIVGNPNVTLYCLDDVARKAVFVELPDDVDLTRAAFVYQTQYEGAKQLFTISYDSFINLAESLPEVDRPIFIHITGRSGSTLLNHALNESGLVKSLAEPDVVSQFATLRSQSAPDREPELQELAKGVIRFLFKAHHAPNIAAHAVKFRNQGTVVMDLFQTAFPQGKNLFLYRDVFGFVASFQRIMRKFDTPGNLQFEEWKKRFELFLGIDLSHLEQYLPEANAEVTLAQQVTLWWLAVIEVYVAQHNQGVPAMAYSYADLVAAPEKSLAAIFRYCDLPAEGVKRGVQAFAQDSQAGTPLARENPVEGNKQGLTAGEQLLVEQILARHPLIGRADFVVPSS